jgi:hypothetical protein
VNISQLKLRSEKFNNNNNSGGSGGGGGGGGDDDDDDNDDNNNVGSVVVAAVSGFVHDYNYDYDDYDYDGQQKGSKAWMKTITQGDSYVVHEVLVAACVKTAAY